MGQPWRSADEAVVMRIFLVRIGRGGMERLVVICMLVVEVEVKGSVGRAD